MFVFGQGRFVIWFEILNSYCICSLSKKNKFVNNILLNKYMQELLKISNQITNRLWQKTNSAIAYDTITYENSHTAPKYH